MQLRELGKTGLKITPLGLGLAEISRQDRMGGDISAAATVLNEALDNGINFLDTAACYADTEALIGDVVSHRRDEYVLATKAGHAVADAPGESWTRETIEHSIDRSLKRLQTDHVDIVQLHSCNVDVLERGDAIDALIRAPGGRQDAIRQLQRRQRGGQVGGRERHLRHASDQLQPSRAARPHEGPVRHGAGGGHGRHPQAPGRQRRLVAEQ